MNNREAELDTPLHQGDVILTLESPGRINVQQTTPRPAPVSQPAQPVASPPVRPAPEPRPMIRKRTLEVLLNGKPLVLEPKENDQPYYVMDLLERSGLDFEGLDRPIQLAVNGVECGFRQVLKDRDSVSIR